MSKPIIGIVEWPYTDTDGDKIYEVFSPIINKVSKAGGLPIGIFPTQGIEYTNFRISELPQLSDRNKKDLIDSLRMCHAIVKPSATRIYPYERFIYDYAREKNIPFLGICAGMQIISHYGKENIANERNDANSTISHNSKEEYAHEVTILKNTLLHSIIGKDKISVNSKHNFHVPDAGYNLVAALSPDGVIEAVESFNADFHLGLQWHPELLNDEYSERIFDALIDASYTYGKKSK